MSAVSTGPELAHHRDADEAADVGTGAEGVEAGRGLQREHHAREHAGEDHDGQRADAEASIWATISRG